MTQVAPFKVEQSHGFLGNYYRAALPVTHSDIHVPDPHSIGFIGKDANSASGGTNVEWQRWFYFYDVLFYVYHMYSQNVYCILLSYNDNYMFDRMPCTLGTLAT